ncbi:hypothetical protein IJZ97_04070 [bacterium]|nr:hypothetical protein [bacterium]
MNKKILKQICFLSLFLGAILGTVTVIPFIGEIAFWILMCLAAVIVILFMTKKEMLEVKSVQESAVLGAIIGFIAFIGFSIFYIPIIVMLAKIFQIYPNYGVSMALSNSSLGLLVILVIFMGVLAATINAFSGFLTYYGIDLYKMLNSKDENETFKLK